MSSYELPPVLERHYEDVKGAEHRRLLQQQKLAQAIKHMRDVESESIAERKKLYGSILPHVQTEVGRFAVEVANTRALVDATATLQLKGGTPANRMAVEAAQLLLRSSVTGKVRAASGHALPDPNLSPPGHCDGTHSQQAGGASPARGVCSATRRSSGPRRGPPPLPAGRAAAAAASAVAGRLRWSHSAGRGCLCGGGDC